MTRAEDSIQAKARKLDKDIESKYFTCQARLAGCTGIGFKVKPDDTVCSHCQREQKKRVSLV